jgi:DNA mismatch repair ATPase MutL
MKARLYMLTIVLGVGVALAQPPQNTPPQNTQPQNTQPQTVPPTTPQSTTPPTSQTNSQGDTKTTAASGSQNGAPAEMKTTTFKGVLVDLGCGSQSSTNAGSTSASTTSSSDASKTADTSKSASSNTSSNSANSNSANRSSSDSSCPVTANSTQLGMKLEDGRTVRFDLVGNQRAQDAIKNDKKWSKDLSSNKEIHARVSGVLNGDKLIVSSIH